MTLTGEGEYNLNILKEIKVTDSFYNLDKKIRNCQSYKGKGSYDLCTTRYFIEQLKTNCGCLPYAISNANINKEKVCGFLIS